MKIKMLILVLLSATFLYGQQASFLPEHPRPDFERSQWINLNGEWDFKFDPKDAGVKEHWEKNQQKYPLKIQVPFPWGAQLSGVKDEADIAWYQRLIEVPANWQSKRTFLVIGASDWKTDVFLDGQKIGSHEGGYTPFSFDLTKFLKSGQKQVLNIRVDDKRRMFTLYGKQGYGNARGIWQTIYLESRGDQYVDYAQVSPDIDQSTAKFQVELAAPAKQKTSVKVTLSAGFSGSQIIATGAKTAQIEIEIPNAHLWSLEDPFLYNYQIQVGEGVQSDEVKGYFGMRKISVMNLPGSTIPYIALNNKPIYLQLALDQSYHPEGFYTFPTDDFMREEIMRSKRIGLNGIRTHVKIEVPRKLYWADKLGLLVMADVPNSWGPPDADMQKETEYTLEQMVRRDFNHPSIFSWITFNETWGLLSDVMVDGKKSRIYTPETQKWVVDVYKKAKSLDPTRLVEDNSICCGKGHTETDIHSWHSYLPGYEWDKFNKEQSDNTFPGGTWNFEKGYKQGGQPMINSEFGNVWGYDGSSGDVDYTWDYHKAMNSFRNFPKMAGWLYTEHHDVINEWNGYYRFDRTEKETGLGAIAPGMTLKDLHGPFYLSTGQEIAWAGNGGQKLKIPLTLSALIGGTDLPKELVLKMEFSGQNALGEKKNWWSKSKQIVWTPWSVKALDSLEITLPEEKSLNTLILKLEDGNGHVLHQNFVSLIVEQGKINVTPKQVLLTVPVDKISKAEWSKKQWSGVLGNKVNGAGSGYFEYNFDWAKLPLESIDQVSFFVEASSKPMLGKDRPNSGPMNGDYMLGKGTFDPSKNPNAYPQTDSKKNPSVVQILSNGQFAASFDLEDDPADHQGVLSWFYQAKNHKLDEPGTYGYWVQCTLPRSSLEVANATGKLTIRLVVPEGYPNGLSLYGAKSGRYINEPSILILRK